MMYGTHTQMKWRLQEDSMRSHFTAQNVVSSNFLRRLFQGISIWHVWSKDNRKQAMETAQLSWKTITDWSRRYMNLGKTRKSQVWQNLKRSIIWFCKTESFFLILYSSMFIIFQGVQFYGIRLIAILRVWVEWDVFPKWLAWYLSSYNFYSWHKTRIRSNLDRKVLIWAYSILSQLDSEGSQGRESNKARI